MKTKITFGKSVSDRVYLISCDVMDLIDTLVSRSVCIPIKSSVDISIYDSIYDSIDNPISNSIEISIKNRIWKQR